MAPPMNKAVSTRQPGGAAFRRAVLAVCLLGAAMSAGAAVVVAPSPGSPVTALAAREICRYVYLRTGQLPQVASRLPKKDDAIALDLDPALAAQEYRLRTRTEGGRHVLAISGGSETALLYGAYDFAEKLGVRFLLEGDAIPDERVALSIPVLDETHKPLFELRGLNPWGSYPEGIDLWGTDDWKQFLHQMVKLRMNFVGVHAYVREMARGTEVYEPEPTVWVGLPGDAGTNGAVAASYPASFFNSLRPQWGYRPVKTGDYLGGVSLLFDRDNWAPAVMGLQVPRPVSPAACNQVFDRTGRMLRDAFGFARMLGIRTCVGTEAPLQIPAAVRERMTAAGMKADDPAALRDVYSGIFRRIMATHPLDYYWIWTDESWAWRGNSKEQMQSVAEELRIAHSAAQRSGATFGLATAGWVLGPVQDRAAWDGILPKDVALSALNRRTGRAPVEPAFGLIQDRPKWAVTWLEDDPSITSPQLWAGRTRVDAADALAYGCNGLMGLHWRTKLLGPQVLALARAGWEQPWSSIVPRPTPATDVEQQDGAVDGRTAAYPDAQIGGTANAEPYRTCRYDLSGYRLNVPNGWYKVTLQFCEPQFEEAGRRVFDVVIQDQPVLEALDIFAAGGRFAAVDRTLENVRVNTGHLAIDFIPRESFPCVSALIVEGTAEATATSGSAPYVRRINCGGGAVGEYNADAVAFAADQMRNQQRTETGPCQDIYDDWAASQFGTNAAPIVAALLAPLDGNHPVPTAWGPGAGAIKPSSDPWAQVETRYWFVREMENASRRASGAGSRDRIEYWLNSFRHMRSQAHVACAWGLFDAVLKEVRSQPDPDAQRKMAEQALLVVYRELVAAVDEAVLFQLAAASTWGDIGTLIDWEAKSWPRIYERTGKELARLLGGSLPADAERSKAYAGAARLIVPTARSLASEGEELKLKVMVLDNEPPTSAAVHWRPMGAGTFAAIPLHHVARAVYEVSLPKAAELGLEYYVEASTADGEMLRWPASAPDINQTVVTMPAAR
jgi:hypothetical protein